MYYLGIDLGGTNIAVGIVDEENKIIARASSKTKLNSAETWPTPWPKPLTKH